MKIGLISGYDPTTSTRGGAEISFFTLAKALVSLGIEVHLITEPPSSNLDAKERVDGIHIHRVLNGLHRFIFCNGGAFSVVLSSRSVATDIAELNRKERFDLIHSCNRNTAAGVVMASKYFGIPSILHVRDYWPFCPTVALQRYYTDIKCGKLSLHCSYCHFHDFKDVYGKVNTLPWSIYASFQTMLRKFYARRASRLIAISEFVKGALIQNKFDNERISVVYNPIEFEEKQNNIRQSQDKKIALFVGNLNAHKGIFDVIEAIKIAHNTLKTNLELRVIGKGNAENSLKKFVKNNNIDYVKILGEIPHHEMHEEYSRADIAVLPFKRPEPFGRVVAEAMSAGVPVVAYATGAIPEIITHNKTGLLVEPNNIKMLAKSIAHLLENDEIRESMAKKAKKTANKKYNPREIARRMKFVYEDALSEYQN